MITTMQQNGKITLPADLLRLDGVKPGQLFDIERLDVGQYRLVRRESPSDFDLVDWLLSCPVKDYFQPIPSESTDDL
jgi:bifunctional DNA-binding transcriptional regulator/antitoxin component of YhaV-PrlF toxin-antitoxin module